MALLCPVPALSSPAGKEGDRAGAYYKKTRLRPAKKGAKRRWVAKQIQRVRHKVHFEKRLKRAKDRIKVTRLGKWGMRLRKKGRRLGRAVRGQLTYTADRLENRLPAGSRRARLFRKVRSVSPLSLGAFSYHKFKQDPVFLGAYKGFSWTFAKVGPPVLLKLGAGVTTSLLLPALIGVPMDLSFILGREHQLRKRQNPQQTLGQTARELSGDYKEFVENRRQQNRRYFKVYTKRFKERSGR